MSMKHFFGKNGQISSIPSLRSATQHLIRYLEHFATMNNAQQCAIVLDIDGTLIDLNQTELIHDMYMLYRVATKLKYHVFFVTARLAMEHGITWTRNQFQQFGIDTYDRIYFMPLSESTQDNFSRYKYYCRQDIVLRYGYPIVLNCGDNWSDLLLMPPFINEGGNMQFLQVINHGVDPQMYHVIENIPDFAPLSFKLT